MLILLTAQQFIGMVCSVCSVAFAPNAAQDYFKEVLHSWMAQHGLRSAQYQWGLHTNTSLLWTKLGPISITDILWLSIFIITTNRYVSYLISLTIPLCGFDCWSYIDGLIGALIINEPSNVFQYDEELILFVGDWYHYQGFDLLANFMSSTNPDGEEPSPNSSKLCPHFPNTPIAPWK